MALEFQSLRELYNKFSSGVSAPASKSHFNPKDPFGSITAGPQQFTVLGDTNHQNPNTIKAIADNIPSMARSGVKHIIVEYMGTPESSDLLGRLYQKPPQATYEDIRRNSELFEAANPVTPEDTIASGKNFAELIINAHKNGMRVHFGGDDAGDDAYYKQKKVEEREAQFVAKNAEIDGIYEQFIVNPEKYRAQLKAQGMSETQILKHVDKLLDYGEKKSVFLDEWLAWNAKFEQGRMSSVQEMVRADRFVNFAKGEKAVVLFGEDHLNNSLDMNEMLDIRTKASAFLRGTVDRWAPTQVMDIYASRQAFREFDQSRSNEREDARYYIDEKKGELTQDGKMAFVETAPQSFAVKAAP